MAEPANLIRFCQTPNTSFYMCRSCRNHVLSKENIRFEDILLNLIFGENAVNVQANDLKPHQFFYHFPVVEVFCNGCGGKLGYKFAKVVAPNQVIQEGRFMLPENRLLYWNGNRVVHADTLQPVEDN